MESPGGIWWGPLSSQEKGGDDLGGQGMRTTKWVSEGTTGVASESLVRTTRLVHSPRCRRVLVSSLSCLHCPRHGAGPSWLGGGEGDTKLEEAHDTESPYHGMSGREWGGRGTGCRGRPARETQVETHPQRGAPDDGLEKVQERFRFMVSRERGP